MISPIDPCICIFGANILHNHSQALLKEMQGVREAADIEYIHRMRVASRRLRSALPLFSDCFESHLAQDWRRQIRKITTALGEARDADVQLDTLKKIYVELPQKKFKPGMHRLILRLSQKRLRMQTAVNDALERFLKKDVVKDIESRVGILLNPDTACTETSLSLYTLADNAISQCIEALLGYSTIICQPEMVEALHAMRIEATRLRYTMEIFAPIYPGALKKQIQIIRKIQEWLGDIHDSDVWLTTLPVFMDEERQRVIKFYGQPGPFNLLTPGLVYLQQNRADFRRQQYTEFVEQWQEWHNKGIWDKFRIILKKPLQQKRGHTKTILSDTPPTIQEVADESSHY
jgi:CHAD domain-containing protein